jgi:hypothetical protein
MAKKVSVTKGEEKAKLFVSVLTSIKVMLNDAGDVWEIQHLLETTDNPFEPEFESEESSISCVMIINWRFDVSSASNITILSEYAEVIESMDQWEFEVVEEA